MYSSILGSTPRINSGSIKGFDDLIFTKHWKPSDSYDEGEWPIANKNPMPRGGEYASLLLLPELFHFLHLQQHLNRSRSQYCPQRAFHLLYFYCQRERYGYISLVIMLVIGVASALVIRASFFLIIAIYELRLLPTAVLVRVAIKLRVWTPFSCAVVRIT